MLTITDKAAQYLREMLVARPEGSSQLLRIVARGGNYELTLDDAQEGDSVYEHEGEQYLVVDPVVAEALAEAVIDAEETPDGTRLVLSSA